MAKFDINRILLSLKNRNEENTELLYAIEKLERKLEKSLKKREKLIETSGLPLFKPNKVL